MSDIFMFRRMDDRGDHVSFFSMPNFQVKQAPPKHGDWFVCGICSSGVFCLNHQGIQFYVQKLTCDVPGTNSLPSQAITRRVQLMSGVVRVGVLVGRCRLE